MRCGAVCLGLALVCACARPVTTDHPSEPLAPVADAPIDVELARRGFEAEGAARAEIVGQLRALGPAGLRSVVEAAGQRRVRGAVGQRSEVETADEEARWGALIDAVAQQRGASSSQLFWYTDLSRARAEAVRTGRPILSLRLLGKLTDEYSCANSRFFRTALYANPDVADWLRSNFVMHWASERPVPRVTVDYGDGRRVHRTVTGNSAHYVLDADGQPIDALPGMYGPGTFRAALEQSVRLHRRLHADPERRAELLADYHSARIDAAVEIVRNDVRPIGRRRISKRKLRASMLAQQWSEVPVAAEAAVRAETKAMTERWLVENITGRRVVLTADGWFVLAERHAEGARLHERSVALMKQERPDLERIDELVAAFEATIAIDAARNEYGLRLRIHDWFARGDVPSTFEAFNARVYSELFLTPAEDQWLGLIEPAVYTGLEDNGVEVSSRSTIR